MFATWCRTLRRRMAATWHLVRVRCTCRVRFRFKFRFRFRVRVRVRVGVRVRVRRVRGVRGAARWSQVS